MTSGGILKIQLNKLKSCKIMSQEELIKQFNQLPEKIQDLLMSEEIADIISEEEQLNYLPAQKGKMIAGLVADVLLGNLSYKEFTPTLIDRLGVNPIVSKNIAQKIESKIFFPVREDLEKIHRRVSFGKQTVEPTTEEMPREVQLAKEPVPAEIKTTEDKEISQAPSPSVILSEQVVSVESPSSIIASVPVEEKTTEKKETPRRSFSNFFRFKKPSHLENKPSTKESSPPGPIIIGKEQEFKPVLEEKSPWMISFEEVKPLKEKVVSEIEISSAENSIQKQEEEKKPIEGEKEEKTSLEFSIPKPNLSSADKDAGKQITPPPAVKIVNYSEKEQSILPTQSTETEIKVDESQIIQPKKIISPESEQTSKPEMPLMSEKKSETPSISEISEIQNPPDVKEPPSSPQKSPESEVPSENVIDLRKLKF